MRDEYICQGCEYTFSTPEGDYKGFCAGCGEKIVYNKKYLSREIVDPKRWLKMPITEDEILDLHNSLAVKKEENKLR